MTRRSEIIIASVLANTFPYYPGCHLPQECFDGLKSSDSEVPGAPLEDAVAAAREHEELALYRAIHITPWRRVIDDPAILHAQAFTGTTDRFVIPCWRGPLEHNDYVSNAPV